MLLAVGKFANSLISSPPSFSSWARKQDCGEDQLRELTNSIQSLLQHFSSVAFFPLYLPFQTCSGETCKYDMQNYGLLAI